MVLRQETRRGRPSHRPRAPRRSAQTRFSGPDDRERQWPRPRRESYSQQAEAERCTGRAQLAIEGRERNGQPLSKFQINRIVEGQSKAIRVLKCFVPDVPVV